MRRGNPSFHDSGGHAPMTCKDPRFVFLTWAKEHERCRKSAAKERDTVITAITVDLEKPITPENTGLAAGKNSFINGGSNRSWLVPNQALKAYLALIWQYTGAEAHFTSGDHRFPTPLPWPNTSDTKIQASVTTTHLFWPNQRRRAISLLPIWLRNFDFAPRETVAGGGGVGPPIIRQKRRSKTALGIFDLMNPLPLQLSKKCATKRCELQTRKVWRNVVGFAFFHEHQGLY